MLSLYIEPPSYTGLCDYRILNDSTLNQLLKIAHQIYINIKEGKDTFSVFLDVSKAVNKVLIMGLLCKIQQLRVVRAFLTGLNQMPQVDTRRW